MDLSKIPPLTSLRAFEAAARHGSLSAAARELNVTHPAVAQQVRRLEEWFGTRLIERAGRGMAPTAAGARLAAGLGDGFTAIARAVGEIGADAENRPLRITLTPSFAVSWFMPRVGQFRAAHRGIELMVNPTSEIIDLVADDYDVGFRFGRGEWPGLQVERIVATDIALIASAEFVERWSISRVEDLVDVPWVQELGRDEARTWLAAHGLPGIEVKNLLNVPGSLVLDAFRRGEGVGLTARSNVSSDIEAGRLVALFEDEADPMVGYYMVYRPAPHREPLKQFLRWVRRTVKEDC